MKRREALVTAGAITGTLCAAVAAFSLTTGLVHDRANDGAGELDPVITVTSEVPAVAVVARHGVASNPTVTTSARGTTATTRITMPMTDRLAARDTGEAAPNARSRAGSAIRCRRQRLARCGARRA